MDGHLVRRVRRGVQSRRVPLRRGAALCDPDGRRPRSPRGHPRGELRRPLRGAQRSPGIRQAPALGGVSRHHGPPPRPVLRGQPVLQRARGLLHGHLGGGQRGAAGGPRHAVARTPHDPPRGGGHGAPGRDGEARAPVRHPGPALLRLRRRVLHRDARLPPRQRVAGAGVQQRLVGAGAAAGPGVPGAVPRVQRGARPGHRRVRAGKRRPPCGRRPTTPRTPCTRAISPRSGRPCC